ncbi:MAG: hypothetical protein PHW73_01120 [Atribacterota bacterium]|nr:hypothetical protein [Atribacterota bacterium]
MEIIDNKWYKKTWFIILLCIIFFPVGFYILLKRLTINTFWKIVIWIGACGVWMIFIMVIIGILSGGIAEQYKKDEALRKIRRIEKQKEERKTDSLKIIADQIKKNIIDSIKLDKNVKTAVKTYLKQTLNDPYSYEDIAWSSVNKITATKLYIIKHRFRVKNAFGIYILQDYMFSIDSTFKVEESVKMN